MILTVAPDGVSSAKSATSRKYTIYDTDEPVAMLISTWHVKQQDYFPLLISFFRLQTTDKLMSVSFVYSQINLFLFPIAVNRLFARPVFLATESIMRTKTDVDTQGQKEKETVYFVGGKEHLSA